jgi:N6-adenosine-specific RNA methylase IME4
MGAELEGLAEADRLLEVAATAPELLDLRNMAEHARILAQQLRLGTSAINHATVIKMRAERKIADVVDAGQAAGEIADQGQRSNVRGPDVSSLDDLGITRQRLAEFRTVRDRYTDDELRDLERAATETDRLLSRDMLVRRAGWELREGKQGRYADTAELGASTILYVDPPWRYAVQISDARAIENQYPTMTDAEIGALPIPAADDAVLFMWATAPKALDAADILRAWGFEYRTQMVWVKDRIGMGYYVRGQHELLYIATRGAPPLPAPADRPSSLIEAPYSGHSVKPHDVYELIERMYPTASKRELFARHRRDGWLEPWGLDAAGGAS